MMCLQYPVPLWIGGEQSIIYRRSLASLSGYAAHDARKNRSVVSCVRAPSSSVAGLAGDSADNAHLTPGREWNLVQQEQEEPWFG